MCGGRDEVHGWQELAELAGPETDWTGPGTHLARLRSSQHNQHRRGSLERLQYFGTADKITYRYMYSALQTILNCIIIFHLTIAINSVSFFIALYCINTDDINMYEPRKVKIKTSKIVVVRSKAKIQNILSRKSLERTKQIQPCC